MASKNPPRRPAANPQTGVDQTSDDRTRINQPRNEGEGNKTADRNYREATREFVNSERGQQEIREAGDVSEDEEREIERAEQEAKSRAREHDPQEVRPSK